MHVLFSFLCWVLDGTFQPENLSQCYEHFFWYYLFANCCFSVFFLKLLIVRCQTSWFQALTFLYFYLLSNLSLFFSFSFWDTSLTLSSDFCSKCVILATISSYIENTSECFFLKQYPIFVSGMYYLSLSLWGY